MNSFAVLEGFSSENVQDFVAKQQQQPKPVAKKVVKPQPKAVKGGQGKALAQATTSKDLREDSTKRGGKTFDRNRVQPRRGRAFDRYNAPGKGSRRPKKGGAGGHNWGRPGEGSEPTEKPVETTETTEEKPATEVPAGETKEETPAETAEPKEVDTTITYEQFLKQKEAESKLKPQANNINLDRVKESLKKEKLAPVQKPQEEEIVLGQKSSKQKVRKNKKVALNLGEVIPESVIERAYSDSNRRGGFTGRGRPQRGGAKNSKRRPDAQDESEFPSL